MSIASHLHYDLDDKVVNTLYLKVLLRLIEEHFPQSIQPGTPLCRSKELLATSSKRMTFRRLAQEFLYLLTPERAGIGFHYGNKLNLIAADALGQVVMSSETVEESLNHLKRFKLLLGLPFDFSLEYRKTGTATSVIAEFNALYCKHYPETLNWFISEAFLNVVQQQASWLTGKPQKYTCLYLPYPKPAHFEMYERHFDCPVIFDSNKHVAEFDAQVLSLSLLTANEVLKTEKIAVCEQALEATEKRFSPSRRLQALFKRTFPELPCIDQAAVELGMSRSALHRKLQDENTSYQCLINDFKRRKSEHFLRHTSYTMSEIAEQIGFSDSSTFRRAFKSWTGIQPSQLRSESEAQSV